MPRGYPLCEGYDSNNHDKSYLLGLILLACGAFGVSFERVSKQFPLFSSQNKIVKVFDPSIRIQRFTSVKVHEIKKETVKEFREARNRDVHWRTIRRRMRNHRKVEFFGKNFSGNCVLGLHWRCIDVPYDVFRNQSANQVHKIETQRKRGKQFIEFVAYPIMV